MMRLLRLVALVFLFVSFLPAQDLPKQISGGPGKPLTPAQAQKLFRLAGDLRIELVASEPQIESPVAMAFAPDGKLWVIEMGDYPNGPAKGEPPAGRIKVLDDKDGDGFFETSRVFADKLLFANGLLHWKDGVIVTAAPSIVHVRDTDGDGKADRQDVLYEGFAALNPQLRVSNPILGLDGWIHVANGLRGGQARVPGKKDAINLGGMDFRFDPLTGDHEAITGMGQFGNTLDDWGQRFVCDNRHHLRHIVLEDRYIRRNPNLAAPGLVHDTSILEDGPLSSGGKIYPLSKNWTTSSLHEGRFTAACGVFIYRGRLLGPGQHGSAFTCDPTGNLVHQEVFRQAGATFVTQPPRKGVEFLASPDDWFRPVFLAHGPDDALYVVDMYRAVIEHPEFMPPELQKRPDLALGKDKGRIWRIVPAQHAGKTPMGIGLAKLSTAELSELLDHDLPWWRTTVHRLLLERQDVAAVEPLRKHLASPTAQTRVHAAYLLDSLIYLDEERLLKLLGDRHPRVRENAVKLAEVRLARSPELQDRLIALAADPDPRVRCQVALALGEWDSERVVAPLARIAVAGDDVWTRLAVASAVVAPEDPEVDKPRVSRAVPVLEAVLRSPEFRKLPAARRLPVIQDFAGLAAAEPVGFKMALLANELGERSLQLALLEGFANGLARKGIRLDDYFVKASPNPNDPVLEWFREFLGVVQRDAADPKADATVRLAAIRLLSRVSWPVAAKSLPGLLAEDVPQEVRLAAVRALALHSDKAAPALLMKDWRSYTPALRREVTEAMFRSPDRILVFLGEIDAKRVRPGDLDALRTRQLLKHRQPNIRVLADRLLRDNLPADRQEILKKYQDALGMKGDAKRGQEIFKKNCATCHRVAGVGIDVGPDIADTRTKTLSALLTDILVPNQAIDNNYVNYVLSTRDGKTLTGIVVAETASSLTLKRAEGQGDVILRSQIEELQSTGVSLMPDGLEKNITVADMADLLDFLKNWRYLDGSVPFGR
ncbi:MAG: HEAT repeat domain-containing protein [Gemmataceae bacterium]|nr:HEAT repeat domain-containing protein [Gemmataceae bacterium]